MSKIHILAIAAAAHAVNKAYCEALGDDSQKSWEDAPQWQKDSAVAGVELHLANPDAGPEASHEFWMAHKTADGWVYGKKKNEKKKTHPCMLPFAELSVEQRAKDSIFRAVVHAVNAIEIPDAVPVEGIPAAPVPEGYTAVKFVLPRQDHVDHLYDTGSWTEGETKNVPDVIAIRLLRHTDVYVKSVEAAAETVEVEEKVQSEESKMQETYDMINAMQPEAVQTFIKTQFNRDVDMAEYGELSKLRAFAIQLADQYGVLA